MQKQCTLFVNSLTLSELKIGATAKYQKLIPSVCSCRSLSQLLIDQAFLTVLVILFLHNKFTLIICILEMLTINTSYIWTIYVFSELK